MSIPITQYPVFFELRKIYREKKDGELIIKGRSFFKTLYFYQGTLIYAKTNVIEERLGEILFKFGKISSNDFLKISKLIEGTHEKLGTILVRKALVTREDLYDALLYQLRTIALSTFYLGSGEYDFISYIPKIPDEFDFNVEIPEIIYEGIENFTSINPFIKKFGSKKPNLLPLTENIKKFITVFEIDIYEKISNLKNLTLDEIYPKLNIPEEIYWKKIILLYLINLLDFDEANADPVSKDNVKEVLSLYERLRQKELDYYALFGLTNRASYAAIKEVYFSYAKRLHPDRISQEPDLKLKEKANFVFAEINRAYEILSNDEKRREYDTEGYKEKAIEGTFKDSLAEKAKILYRKSKTLHTLKKYREAASFMEEAIKMDGNKANYYLLLGLAQMNIAGQKHIAEKNFQKVIEMDKYNIDALLALGVLFMDENQLLRSEGFFKRALSINPDHQLAKKKLAEIENLLLKDKKSKFSIFKRKKK